MLEREKNAVAGDGGGGEKRGGGGVGVLCSIIYIRDTIMVNFLVVMFCFVFLFSISNLM